MLDIGSTTSRNSTVTAPVHGAAISFGLEDKR